MNPLKALLDQGGFHAAAALATLVLFGIAVASAIVLFFLYHFSSRRRRRFNSRLRAAEDLLRTALGDPLRWFLAVADCHSVAGGRATAHALRSLRASQTGEMRARLTAALEEAGEVARLAKKTSSRRAWVRRAAVRGLAECGGSSAHTSIAGRLGDADPEVRRLALIGLLDSPRTEDVQQAIRSHLSERSRQLGLEVDFFHRLALAAPAEAYRLISFGGLDEQRSKIAPMPDGISVVGSVEHVVLDYYGCGAGGRPQRNLMSRIVEVHS